MIFHYFRVDACYEGSRDFSKPFMQVGVVYPLDKAVENTEAIVKKYLALFEQVLMKLTWNVN